MLAVVDLDVHLANEPNKLAGPGIGHDRDTQLRRTARHGAGMLQCEGADVTMQRSGDPLHCDVTGRAFDIRADGQHLALAGRFKIAVKLFVDRQPAHGGVADFVFRRLREHLNLERSTGMLRHGRSLLVCLGNQRIRSFSSPFGSHVNLEIDSRIECGRVATSRAWLLD